MKALCIDFETANQFTGSICSVGIALIDKLEIEFKKSWLIQPHKKYNYFNQLNIDIHGIKKSAIATEPEFDNIYLNHIKPILNNVIFVAHNASFDMSALRNVLDLYKLPYPDINYLCTCNLARKMWPNLNNHKLNTVSDYLNHQFKHHDAFDDAVACAKILTSAYKITKTTSPIELAKSLGMSLLNLSNKSDHMYNINSFARRPAKKIVYLDATIEAQKIFSCVKRVQEKQPVKIVAAILKGENNLEIVQNKFNSLSTFGIMQEYEVPEIEKIIDELAFQGYLIYTANLVGHIPIVKLNTKAKTVLWQNAKVQIDKSKNLLKG